ncbi:MAG: hypothetical protein FWC03_03175 [Treponema sp.]|nr:hypothetical protein [Treponema sp.]
MKALNSIKKINRKASHGFTRSVLLFLILFLFLTGTSYAQEIIRDDSDAALRYVNWAQQAIDEEKWEEALAALERAADFSGVSSDISYMLAVARLHEGKDRQLILDALDKAIDVNRWVKYSENQALLLKAEQLIVMRNFYGVLAALDKIGEGEASMQADMAMLRLLVYRGLALGNDVQALARFRSLLMTAMDRYPRDPCPLRIFFEYARNRNPEPQASAPRESDANLLDLALRRLPFLLETDPDLAWMAAPFIRDDDTARRHVASYRAGGLFGEAVKNFKPSYNSIPIALNLGLIDDFAAAEELFAVAANERPVLDDTIIADVYSLLRSAEGRVFFTQKLHEFTGIITHDDDMDGYIDRRAHYSSGAPRMLEFTANKNNDINFIVFFDMNGIPVSAECPVQGQKNKAQILWERYPSVREVRLGKEIFQFRPADFQFAPVAFNVLGGGGYLEGLRLPVPSYNNINLTYRSLVSFSEGFSRPSSEFEGAVEQIFLERGIPYQAVETLNGRVVSITEFQMGAPAIQRVDFDLDGRMETIRRFRRPSSGFSETFDFRSLIASSESDWSGDGRYKTMEMYLPDGSVVYLYDMDGSGEFNYSHTGTGME